MDDKYFSRGNLSTAFGEYNRFFIGDSQVVTLFATTHFHSHRVSHLICCSPVRPFDVDEGSRYDMPYRGLSWDKAHFACIRNDDTVA